MTLLSCVRRGCFVFDGSVGGVRDEVSPDTLLFHRTILRDDVLHSVVKATQRPMPAAAYAFRSSYKM